MKEEYTALLKNETWSLVPLPSNRESIGCKWVFRIKENPDGTINKYKARLVAKGYHQQPGYDYTETFSPVIKPVTIRIMLTLALTYGWTLKQIDVNNAFLNGFLQEEVYMDQPPGFQNTNKALVCKLHKALYGLKQAPRAWFERLHKALLSLQFKPSKCDPSLFVYSASNEVVYVLVYVDDIILTGNSSTLIQRFITQLDQQFSLKQLGTLNYFLGIEVSPFEGGLLLTQQKYIRDLLSKVKMLDCKPISTPMVSTSRLSKSHGIPFNDPSLYRSIVGALQYLTITRPEISFSVNKVSQFMSSPLDTHWTAVKRVLRYLKGTMTHGLHYKPAKCLPLQLKGFSDADWATDMDDRRSIS
jgi:histone deacetylase 1/2